jgi:hypothetical protein
MRGRVRRWQARRTLCSKLLHNYRGFIPALLDKGAKRFWYARATIQ